MKRKINFWLIIAIVSFLIGLGVRFYYGLSTDLWDDEALSYFIAKDTAWFDLLFSSGKYWDFNHPPLYYVFLKIILFFGNQDWFLRLTSLSWFILSAFLVYSVGKQIGNKKTSLISLSLFSLHPLLNNLSFQVRPYSMTIFLILLCLKLIVKNLLSANFKKEWLIGLILAIAFYADYSSFWLVIGIVFFGILMWIKKRQDLLKKIAKTVVYFLIFASYQLIILVNFLFSNCNLSQIVGSVSENSFAWFLEQFKDMTGLETFMISLLMIFFLCSKFIIKENKDVRILFLTIIFSSLIFSSFYSIFFQPIFLARNLIIVSLVFIFLLSQLKSSIGSTFLIILILFIYGTRSLQGYKFLYIEGLEQYLSKITDKDIIVFFFDYQSLFYFYLEKKEKKPTFVQYYDLEQINKLSTKSNQKYFLLYDYQINNLPNELKKASQEIESKICNNNYCEKMKF